MNILTLPRIAAFTLLVATTTIRGVAHEGPAGHSHEPGQHSHEHSSADSFFTTRPNPLVLPLAKEDDVFHFVVYGDRTGGVPEGLQILEQAVADTNLLDPDLVMTVGDLVQGYTDTPDWVQQATEYKGIMNQLQMRWFPVVGNHDVYWRGVGKPPEGHNEANYEKHFGPLWYTFQHKNAGFIVLYSDEGDRATNEKGTHEARLQTMSEVQLEFLRQALKQHAAKQHVFVFLHHPRWVGGKYTGGNWDIVHQLLKDAGNVSAVFAGHIHHMRFDGPKDGISYYTLATTGGNLSADIPDAGYLHHMDIVTVRPDTVTVASLPVGAVMDPKQFTPEFLAEIDKARGVRPIETQNDLELQIDGTAAGSVTFSLTNTTAQPIDATASFESLGGDWLASLDHDHFSIAADERIELTFKLRRVEGFEVPLSIPNLRLDMQYVGSASRISLPPVVTPISFRLAAVPADYFRNVENRCLDVTSDQASVRIDSAEFKLPDGPFTLEAWMNPSQSAGMRGLVAKAEKSEYALLMNEGVPQFQVYLDGHYVVAKASDLVTNHQWTHVAGVFDGSQLRIYVNGKLVGSKPGQGKRTRNKLPLFIGADTSDSGQSTRAFLGKVDEVRLSTAAVYDTDFTPLRRLEPDANTMLLHHLDQTFGPFVLDHSISAARGTLEPDAKLVPVE